MISAAVFAVALVLTGPQVLLFPNPSTWHEAFLIASLLLPLVGLAYSIISIKAPRPWLLVVFILDSGASLLDVYFSGAHFNDWSDLLLPAAAVSGILVLIFLVFLRPVQSTAAVLAAAVLFSASYGFAAIRAIDWGLDRSGPRIIQTRVLAKRTYEKSHGGTNYWLSLEKWEGMRRSVAISVAPDMYNAKSEGDSIEVLQREGALRIPWYSFSIFTDAVQ